MFVFPFFIPIASLRFHWVPFRCKYLPSPNEIVKRHWILSVSPSRTQLFFWIFLVDSLRNPKVVAVMKALYMCSINSNQHQTLHVFIYKRDGGSFNRFSMQTLHFAHPHRIILRNCIKEIYHCLSSFHTHIIMQNYVLLSSSSVACRIYGAAFLSAHIYKSLRKASAVKKAEMAR